MESVILKVLKPTKCKEQWLNEMADAFSQAVQFALDIAQRERSTSRGRIHKLAYREIRNRFNLPASYTRMAINHTISLARSYYGLRRNQHIKRVSFPKVNGSQGIGLGIDAYKIVESGDRFVLRVSTGTRGRYIWLPLCVPPKYHNRLALVRGDARLFKRNDDWYIMLPIRTSPTPAVCDGESTFIGVDLGIVRLATIATPGGIIHFSGKEARQKREHFATLRRRYQKANRRDRVKAQKGRESNWTKDINHKMSATIVNTSLRYEHPVIVLESLDGIRNRLKASKRFNRMMSSWAFRQLINYIEYKAARHGIPVIFIDPRGTSKTCPKCGHNTRSNRPNQSNFRCVACGYQGNADAVAAMNIARRGFDALSDGPPDTARPCGQTGDIGSRPDVVKGAAF